VAGALSPQLSALRPRPDHPEWDTAIWFDVLTIPGTLAAQEFYRDLEQWMLATYTVRTRRCGPSDPASIPTAPSRTPS
jgi:hypothetical protein